MSLQDAFISGVGQSAVGQGLTRSPLALTRDAFVEALQECGLTVEQVDGVATYPGRTPTYPGLSPLGAEDVIDAFGIKSNWHFGGAELTSQLGAIEAAADAVRAGRARHVMCFRTVYEAAAMARPSEYPPLQAKNISGYSQWLAPFFSSSPVNSIAQYAMRHVVEYGLTRQQLGQIAVNAYKNASLNPRALIKKPISIEQYLSSRMISSPLCLYDCDRYTDASTVLIVSSANALDEISCKPIRIAATSGAVDRYSWDQLEWMAPYQAGEALWQRTDYGPEDVDVAQLYDGFSFVALAWIEALGFCARGEGGAFIEGGHRIAIDGELPVNTAGGQIGAGRLHGFGFAHEAVVQLRGKGGARQVSGAPEVAVATAGGGPMGTAMLLTSH